MSTAVIDRVSEIQEQVIDAISSVKEPLSNAVGTVVSFVVERVDLPAVPYAQKIPTPKEIIDNQAKFATKLVATNKSVALGAATAAAPLTNQLLDRKAPAKKAAAKVAA